MKKEIVQVDKQRGIVRCTTLDERFYGREGKDPVTGLPTFEWRPSITYIAGFYPKGKQFEAFLKNNGDNADVIRDLAAERGSKVHQAIEALNNGETVKMADKFVNNRTGQLEELTPDEYGCVMSYRDWWEAEGSKEYEIIEAEDVIWPEGPGSEPGGPLHFAATRDVRLRRKADGTTGTVDVKTSQAIYPSHIIQVSAIAEANGDAWQAIFQAGYRRNKTNYKFTEVPRRMDLYLAARTIWAYETEGDKPLQRDYPLSLSLGLPKKPASHVQVPDAEEVNQELERMIATGENAIVANEPGPIEKAVTAAEEAGEPELADRIAKRGKKVAAQEDEAVENYEDAA